MTTATEILNTINTEVNLIGLQILLERGEKVLLPQELIDLTDKLTTLQNEMIKKAHEIKQQEKNPQAPENDKCATAPEKFPQAIRELLEEADSNVYCLAETADKLELLASVWEKYLQLEQFKDGLSQLTGYVEEKTPVEIKQARAIRFLQSQMDKLTIESLDRRLPNYEGTYQTDIRTASRETALISNIYKLLTNYCALGTDNSGQEDLVSSIIKDPIRAGKLARLLDIFAKETPESMKDYAVHELKLKQELIDNFIVDLNKKTKEYIKNEVEEFFSILQILSIEALQNFKPANAAEELKGKAKVEATIANESTNLMAALFKGNVEVEQDSSLAPFLVPSKILQIEEKLTLLKNFDNNSLHLAISEKIYTPEERNKIAALMNLFAEDTIFINGIYNKMPVKYPENPTLDAAAKANAETAAHPVGQAADGAQPRAVKVDRTDTKVTKTGEVDRKVAHPTKNTKSLLQIVLLLPFALKSLLSKRDADLDTNRAIFTAPEKGGQRGITSRLGKFLGFWKKPQSDEPASDLIEEKITELHSKPPIKH